MHTDPSLRARVYTHVERASAVVPRQWQGYVACVCVYVYIYTYIIYISTAVAVIGVSTSANISAALTLAIGRCLIKLSLASNGVLINRRLILVLGGGSFVERE